MKRFVNVCGQPEDKEFINRCDCAVACGYVPCGHAFATAPELEGEGSITGGEDRLDNDDNPLYRKGISGKFSISTKGVFCKVSQSFYDPEGKATMICAHCTKCESCQIAPEEDVYCSCFENKCYADED